MYILGFKLRVLPMSAVLCGCSVLPIDIRYQVSGVRYCSSSQYLDYCLFSGLSALMRVQYASCCSRSILGIFILQVVVSCDTVRTAAAAVLLLVLRLGLLSSSCSNRPQKQRCLPLLLLLLLLLYFMLCCCYRFHVRERPPLLQKRRWK